MQQARISEGIVTDDSNSSGVSWGAVLAGAFVAAALSLALLALGTGIGFSAVSPWANSGASVSTIGWTAIIWVILMQLISSSMGGYLAGRLRTKWVRVHTHEVYFRDTAHGFLVWAVGLVIAAGFLTSAAGSMVGQAERTGATAAAEAPKSAQSPASLGRTGYFVDTLLRANGANSGRDEVSVRDETGLIFANGLREGSLPAADESYLAQVVTARTGLSKPDAEKRVEEVFARAQQSADKIRKAAAHAMYWGFLALLIGAFCASVAATIGGEQRDGVKAI